MPLPRLAGRGEAEIGEEHLAELLGRVDVEAPPRKLEDALAYAVQLHCEAFGEAVENAKIDAHAGLLHAVENRRERQVDLAVDALDACFFRLREQRGNQRMNGRRARGQRGRRGLPVARRHIGQRLRGVRRIQRVGEQHGVVHRAAQHYALRSQQMESGLPIVGLLGDCCIFKQCAQFAGQRQAQRNRRLRADAYAEAGLLFGGLGHIEQRKRSAALRLPSPAARARRHRARRQSRARARRRRRRLSALAVGSSINLDRTAAVRRRKVAQHGGELKLGEEFAAGFEVRRLRLHRGQIQRQRHVAVDGDQLLGEQDGVAILLQRLAIAFALDLAGAVEDRLHGAEFD